MRSGSARSRFGLILCGLYLFGVIGAGLVAAQRLATSADMPGLAGNRSGSAGASLESSTRGPGRAPRQKLKEVIASWLVLSVLCPTS